MSIGQSARNDEQGHAAASNLSGALPLSGREARSSVAESLCLIHSLTHTFSISVCRCRWWCEICDPVLCYNPLWIKYLSMLSPFVFLPFYFVAMWAIVTRREWIRIPVIIYSSILFVDLSAFFVEGIWGEMPSPSMAIFTAVRKHRHIYTQRTAR